MTDKIDIKINAGSLLRFAAPSIVMMLVMSLYTVVDGIFVARLVNTDAFSAVNIVYPLSSLVVALGTMFGTGLVAVVSKKLGENRGREANEIMTHITIVAVTLAVALAGVCLACLPQLLRLLGANDAIYGYAYDYALPLLCFFPASILQLLFGNLVIANGKPQLGLLLTIGGGVANIVLDYVFIKVCNMGIAGAAVATGIGYSIPAVAGLLYFSLYRSGSLYFVRPKARWRQVAATMANGSSEMVSNLSTSVTTLLFNLIMMKYLGQNGVAAIAVVMYLDFVLVSVSLGYSMGVAPVVSYNYGKGDREKQRAVFRLSFLFCAITGVVTTVLTATLSRYLVGVFTGEDAVTAIAVKGLTIFAAGYLFKGCNIYASAMFTAYSNGLVSALISLLRSLVLQVIAVLALTALFGIEGIWYAVPLAELLTLAVATVFLVKYSKRYGYGKDRAASAQEV